MTAINWYLTAATLRSAFMLDHREDGSEFWRLTDEARATVDDLSEFVRQLHDSELPNDWRYQKIAEILDAITEYPSDSDWCDVAHEITDGLVSIYNAELAAWIAENGSRLDYCDQAMEEGLVPDDAPMTQRLMAGQYDCIKTMVDLIMLKLNLQDNA